MKLLISFALIALGSACVSPSDISGQSRISVDRERTIKVNQLGYLPNSEKVAIVPVINEVTRADGVEFSILSLATEQVVFTSTLSRKRYWYFSNEQVRRADFSQLTEPGQYVLRVTGLGESYPFSIQAKSFDKVHEAALKSYYLNRSAIALDPSYAGKFARRAGHPDTEVEIHPSAASTQRPAGSIISAPKGWYDAGDYGKYTVNSGITTYTLLSAYQHFAGMYQNLDLNIPESENQLPDILDEVKWNLDWLEAMQDSDGGVYHKLTTLRFSPNETAPHEGLKRRYAIGKSVTASLDFAAVMAVASRVFADFETEQPGVSERYKQAALNAWSWAQQHSTAIYVQPKDVKTGAYDDNDANDEFAWAAAELFLLTKESRFIEEFLERNADPSTNLSWRQVGPLGYLSLSNAFLSTSPQSKAGESVLTTKQAEIINSKLLQAANQLQAVHATSAYHVAADIEDFEWGSNSNILNNGLVLVQAYRLTQEEKYRNAAVSTVNYVLGKNALNLSFVTGFGSQSPKNIHHRPSIADDVAEPIPGFLAGGPHSGQQDKCNYKSDLPALSYVDEVCSYATNEIAINWNAPLVYMLAATINLH